MITVPTQRFGVITRPVEDVIAFPSGIFGFELQLRWLLLGDREHGGLYWLQNIEDVDLSLPLVEPREFVPEYSLHVQRTQLCSLGQGSSPLLVLSVLTEYEGNLCLNLRNPIVINPKIRIGAQVVTSDASPLQYVLPGQTSPLKKSA